MSLFPATGRWCHVWVVSVIWVCLSCWFLWLWPARFYLECPVFVVWSVFWSLFLGTCFVWWFVLLAVYGVYVYPVWFFCLTQRLSFFCGQLCKSVCLYPWDFWEIEKYNLYTGTQYEIQFDIKDFSEGFHIKTFLCKVVLRYERTLKEQVSFSIKYLCVCGQEFWSLLTNWFDEWFNDSLTMIQKIWVSGIIQMLTF